MLLQIGGVVGGNISAEQGATYTKGSCYRTRFENPTIVDGYLYYTEPVSFSGPTDGPIVCVKMLTGQLVWSKTSMQFFNNHEEKKRLRRLWLNSQSHCSERAFAFALPLL